MRKLLSLVAIAIIASPVWAASSEEIDAVMPEIVGAWKLEFTTPDNVERTPIVLVGRQNDKLVAWYVVEEKPQAFEKVDLKDESLVMTFHPEDHKDLEVTLTARLEGDGKCAGEGTFKSQDGDSGSWDFSGERVKPSDFDQTQMWALKFVTPDGEERKAEVTVFAKGDKLYAWYSSEKYELPAKEIKMDGDEVTLALSSKTPDGMDIGLTFVGTVSGDSVAGEATYELEGGDTGTFPFTGKAKQ